jgi:hypothetical protein
MATMPTLPRGVSDYVAALDLTAIAVTRDGRQLPMFAHCCAIRPLSQAAVRAPFLLDKVPGRSAEKEVGGYCMFAMVVGAGVALILIGLPLAIIGLFIMSIVDRMRSSPEHLSGRAGSEPGRTRSGQFGLVRHRIATHFGGHAPARW